MDYRNFKPEELNSNIPKGRGMIKWAPFATMPEQFENVRKLEENQVKIERPILSDDRIEELNRNLNYALQYNKNINIKYYYDGYSFNVSLEVIKIDQWSLVLIGRYLNSYETFFIPFMDIIQIEYI